jgi:diaminohydroxyphosphoribosylaminopyrimidine deaminase / 5-amino-6-(5-phosphoribosylamino)uracil reductase
LKHEENDNLIFYQVTRDVNLVHQVVNGLYQMKILSVMIEGGARLIQSFIDEGMWDEARVITNRSLVLNHGVASPILTDAALKSETEIHDDIIRTYISK